MENEEEDEEQRRERILAEENGQDLGAALGDVYKRQPSTRVPEESMSPL